MPQAIGALVVSALGIVAGTTTAIIVGAVVSFAVTLGLSFIANALFKPGARKPSDGKRVIRESVGSRVRHYGKVRVGGQLTFYESKGGDLYSLITTSHGQINAVSEYLINGNAVTVDGAGLVTDAKFQGAVSMFAKLGTDDQTAHAQLASAFSEWTSDHRQRGCSNVLTIARGVDAEAFSTVYEGNREPEASITAETSLVYDPRLDDTAGGSGSHRLADVSTWEYSDNWALCFADYLAHPDGYGLGYDRINWSNIAEQADICDEAISTVDARTVARWRVAGSYLLADNERRAVEKEFLKAGDGQLWQDQDGLANIRCGYWIEPTVHLPEQHILGCAATLGPDATDRANEVRVVYTDPFQDYTETESEPTVDTATQAALGRREASRVDIYFCPDHNQAKRLAKRILSKLGERWVLELKTNLFGLNMVGERFITCTISELSIDAIAFEVTSLKINLETMSVDLGLIEVREDDFAFDAATEEGTPPGATPTLTNPIAIEEVANLALSTVQLVIGGAAGVAISATWDAPSRAGLFAQVQYQEDGASVWQEMTVTQNDRIATSGLISEGVLYHVRARFVTISGRPSDWSAEEDITPEADEIVYDGGVET